MPHDQTITEFFRTQIQSDRFMRREGTFNAPSLAGILFPEGVKAEFKIRQLTLSELFRVREADEQLAVVRDTAEALAGVAGKDRIDTLTKALGLGNEVPGAAKRAHLIISFGTVEPQLDLESAVYFGERFPVEASQLSSAILDLTGKGATLGKV